MITGRSLSVEGNCYTSQLNVTVGPSLNNQTVECTYSGGGMSIIGSSIIDISRGKNQKVVLHKFLGILSLLSYYFLADNFSILIFNRLSST
jgi:hypothetical protein